MGLSDSGALQWSVMYLLCPISAGGTIWSGRVPLVHACHSTTETNGISITVLRLHKVSIKIDLCKLESVTDTNIFVSSIELCLNKNNN